MMMRSLTLLAALAFSASPALALDARLAEAWEQGPQRADRVRSLVADPALSEAELAEAMTSVDWQVRQQAAVVDGWRRWPELFQRYQSQQAIPTRGGVLRFRGAELADARLAPLFLERLLQQPEPALRLALLEVLPRTGGDWAQAYLDLMRLEPDPELKAFMVASMRWAEGKYGLEAIRLGLEDDSGLVRGEAARAAGWHAQGASLGAELARACGDVDPYTRAMAARSLGYLRVREGFAALLPLLRDADAGVRLQALHALERLDAEALRARPELDDLAHDPDAGVRRAATSLR
jgi:hypothetical protein